MENKDLIYFGILFLCLALIGYLIFMLMGDGGQCLKNPYIYGASKMGGVSCSCYQDKGGICDPKFSFNDTSFDAGVTKCGNPNAKVYLNYRDLNLSGIIITP